MASGSTEEPGSPKNEDVRLVLVGKTGSGKSATGNTILNDKLFQSSFSSSSITKQCKKGERNIDGNRYLVTDTPGLFDTSLTEEEIMKEIGACVEMSLPGPHAFLLVVGVGRFTKEETETFNKLFEQFGRDVNSFAVIVFTGIDAIDDENIDSFLTGCDSNLKNFLEKCNNRYVGFNNKGSSEKKEAYITKLKDILRNMNQSNAGKHYTNDMYEKAVLELKQKKEEERRRKEEEKKREFEIMAQPLKSQLTKIKSDNTNLNAHLKQIERDNTNLDAHLKQIERDNTNLNAHLNQIERDNTNLKEVNEQYKKQQDQEHQEMKNKYEKSNEKIIEMKDAEIKKLKADKCIIQ